MAVLLYVYAVYFMVGLSRIYEYVYWELMNLGLRMIGFQPTVHTVLLYVYPGAVLVLGFLIGSALADRATLSPGRGQARSRWPHDLRSRILARLSGAAERVGFESKEPGRWLMTKTVSKGPESTRISSDYQWLKLPIRPRSGRRCEQRHMKS